MHAPKLRLPSIVFATMVLTANLAWPLGFELSQTKDELELKYDVSAVVHNSGRVSVSLTIADQGKLEPLQSVQLAIPSEDGTGYFDLVVSLATTNTDGKLSARAHLSRQLAERATINLTTSTLDGEKQALTWYYHQIPIAKYIKDGQKKN